MPDVRLIDANALIKGFEDAGLGDHSLIESVLAAGVYAGIENAPTIDAVEVVRCKDCKFRGFDSCPMCHDEYAYDEDDGGDYFTVDNTSDDGFCQNGAKMNENKKED